MLHHVVDPSSGELRDVYLEWAHYDDGSLRFQLVDVLADPIIAPTVDPVAGRVPLEEDEVVILTYGKTAGWVNALVQAGILEPVRPVPYGQDQEPAQVCRLLVLPPKPTAALGGL